MGDFFHGWRRKLGLLTLVMACVLMGGWVRSMSVDDYITFSIGDLGAGLVISTDGCFICTWSLNPEDAVTNWDALYFPIVGTTGFSDELLNKLNENDAAKTASEVTAERHLLPYWLTKSFQGTSYEIIDTEHSHSLVPYCPFVIAMITISAYLLIRKPRQPE